MKAKVVVQVVFNMHYLAQVLEVYQAHVPQLIQPLNKRSLSEDLLIYGIPHGFTQTSQMLIFIYD